MKINKYLDAEYRILDPRSRDLEPAKGDVGFSGGLVKGVDVDNRTLTALVSTPNVDRYEEIVEPKAFSKWLEVFNSNPVFVAGHTYGGFSGEPTVIGSWKDMRVTKEGLVGTAQFATTPLAEQYWQLYVDGHMRAFSVGWLTHQWEMREFELSAGVTKNIRVFTEVELIEVSAVSIPANRESLVRAASYAGPAQPDQVVASQDTVTHSQVQEIVEKTLSAEPGSPLALLIQAVVEETHAAGAKAYWGDDGNRGEVSAADDDTVKAMEKLRAASAQRRRAG